MAIALIERAAYVSHIIDDRVDKLEWPDWSSMICIHELNS